MIYANCLASPVQTLLRASAYDLAGTLRSGQAFRWKFREGAWEGVVQRRWVRLRAAPEGIVAQVAEAAADWSWLRDYLQTEIDLEQVIRSFPDDVPLRAAVRACAGLRLLRQDPWECLASFILSSTKQIVQIQQIVSELCERLGESVAVPAGDPPAYSFPTAERIAACGEGELRGCKMGFRAVYLKAAAEEAARGRIDLHGLAHLDVEQARAELVRLHGVGRKIADCVLLFAYGFPAAFPVDVWVMKALRELYFPGRTVRLKELQEFSASYFGPHAGYAQQYLFHYMRTRQEPGPKQRRARSC